MHGFVTGKTHPNLAQGLKPNIYRIQAWKDLSMKESREMPLQFVTVPRE